MTDLKTLESDVLAQVAAAADLSALDAVRVAALGKTGSISGLLKTLGAMSPEERKTQGAAINALRREATEKLEAARSAAYQRPLRAAPGLPHARWPERRVHRDHPAAIGHDDAASRLAAARRAPL